MTILKKRIKRISMLSILLICLAIIFAISFNLKREQSKEQSDEDSTNNIGVTEVTGTSYDSDNVESNPFEGISTTNENIKIPVLCYHSIVDAESTESPIEVTLEQFKKHMQAIKDADYTTLTISQFRDYLLNNKPIPEKSILITFDDAYMDNYTLAFPVLKDLHMNATIFTISNSLDGKRFMSPEIVKEMSDYGIDIQGHTYSHPELATLSYEKQFEELNNSKKFLENLTGKEVFAIAYPFGSYNDDTIKASKALEYSMSFTVKKGHVERTDNPYELDRILIDYTFKERHIKNILNK